MYSDAFIHVSKRPALVFWYAAALLRLFSCVKKICRLRRASDLRLWLWCKSPTVFAVGFWLLTASSAPNQQQCCLLRIKRGPHGLFVGFADVFPCPLRQLGRGSGPRLPTSGASAACCCLTLTPAELRPLHCFGDTRQQSIEGQWGEAWGSNGFAG